MIKKVLIALDYGPEAERIAEEGFSLCTALGTEVTLLHIVQNPAYYASDVYSPITGFGGFLNLDYSLPGIAEELKKTSANFLENIKAHLGDINIKTLVIEGDVTNSILESAKEKGNNIIVIGSHSRRWLEQIIMGSVAQKVLQHTPIPVFIIPTGKKA